jgi:hypothetical protein
MNHLGRQVTRIAIRRTGGSTYWSIPGLLGATLRDTIVTRHARRNPHGQPTTKTLHSFPRLELQTELTIGGNFWNEIFRAMSTSPGAASPDTPSAGYETHLHQQKNSATFQTLEAIVEHPDGLVAKIAGLRAITAQISVRTGRSVKATATFNGLTRAAAGSFPATAVESAEIVPPHKAKYYRHTGTTHPGTASPILDFEDAETTSLGIIVRHDSTPTDYHEEGAPTRHRMNFAPEIYIDQRVNLPDAEAKEIAEQQHIGRSRAVFAHSDGTQKIQIDLPQIRAQITRHDIAEQGEQEVSIAAQAQPDENGTTAQFEFVKAS